jgi:hypothetical protein
MQFNFNNENHTIKLNDIINNKAIITVSSEPVTFTLGLNETKKINLNNDSYYDLSIFLKNISNSNANLIIKTIYEQISAGQTAVLPSEASKKIGNIVSYGIAGIILILIIAYFIFWKKRIKRKKR